MTKWYDVPLRRKSRRRTLVAGESVKQTDVHEGPLSLLPEGLTAMRRSLRSLRFALPLVIGTALAVPVSSHAQDGRIAGTVRTASGSPLANARITVTNAASGVTRSAATGADGGYTVTRVADGTYTVSVALVGYRPVIAWRGKTSSVKSTAIDPRTRTFSCEPGERTDGR